MKLFDLIETTIERTPEQSVDPFRIGDEGIIMGTDGYGGYYIAFHHLKDLVLLREDELKHKASLTNGGSDYIKFDYTETTVYMPISR